MSGAEALGAGRFVTRDGLCWLEPAALLMPGVRVAVTTRAGGVSLASREGLNLASHVGDEAERVAENRRRLRHALALPAEPCWLQVGAVPRLRPSISPACLSVDLSASDLNWPPWR